MSNPFSINNLLYPLTKGDTPGHAFHGNQYSAGQSAGVTHAGATREQSNVGIHDMTNKISSLRSRMLDPFKGGTKVNDLNRLSLLHNKLADIHINRGDLKAAELSNHASDVAHQAYIHALTENNGNGKANIDPLSKFVGEAHAASNNALGASYDSMQV